MEAGAIHVLLLIRIRHVKIVLYLCVWKKTDQNEQNRTEQNRISYQREGRRDEHCSRMEGFIVMVVLAALSAHSHGATLAGKSNVIMLLTDDQVRMPPSPSFTPKIHDQ